MVTIVFNGLKRDAKRISFAKFLSYKTQISMYEAKEISDRIIDGETIELNIVSKSIALEIIDESIKLGYNCKMLDK